MPGGCSFRRAPPHSQGARLIDFEHPKGFLMFALEVETVLVNEIQAFVSRRLYGELIFPPSIE